MFTIVSYLHVLAIMRTMGIKKLPTNLCEILGLRASCSLIRTSKINTTSLKSTNICPHKRNGCWAQKLHSFTFLRSQDIFSTISEVLENFLSADERVKL